MTLPDRLSLLTRRLAAPLWAGYIVSAAWYIYQIVSALNLRTAVDPPILFAREHRAGDLFALVGTLQWFVFGFNHRASGAAAVGSLILAGLHVLLLAVRAYIVPTLWILEQTAR